MAQQSKAWKDFERETAALAGADDKTKKPYGRRVILSGAVGSKDGNPIFVGDAQWDWPWLDRKITIECKHGYDEGRGDKSIRLRKEWFDKHYDQAKAHNMLPMFTMKIKLARQNGLSKFALVPFPVMKEMVAAMQNMYIELEELRERVNNEDNNN